MENRLEPRCTFMHKHPPERLQEGQHQRYAAWREVTPEICALAQKQLGDAQSAAIHREHGRRSARVPPRLRAAWWPRWTINSAAASAAATISDSLRPRLQLPPPLACQNRACVLFAIGGDL